MRGLLTLLAVLLLFASGCARPQENPYEPDTSPGTGAARVIVQDNHQERVVGATVLLQPAGVFGKTDDSGIFVASDLTPGNFTATINAQCYADARSRPFPVTAGEVAEAVVIIDRTC